MITINQKTIPCLSDILLKDDEYINADGMICCKVCKKPRYNCWDMFGRIFTFKEDCDCQKIQNAERERIEEIEREKRQREERLENIRHNSRLEKKFDAVSFEKTNLKVDTSFQQAFNICRNYCNSFDKSLDNGYGLYLFGDCGVGKSHLAACMANELMNKHLRSVVYTNFSDIDRQVKQAMDWGGDKEAIRLFTNVDFLFIDDLGTERIVNANGQDLMLQQTIYDIINGRYVKCKPIIITSNYSLNELIEKTGIMQKTVDRIYEMATRKIEITGDSYRLR